MADWFPKAAKASKGAAGVVVDDSPICTIDAHPGEPDGRTSSKGALAFGSSELDTLLLTNSMPWSAIWVMATSE